MPPDSICGFLFNSRLDFPSWRLLRTYFSNALDMGLRLSSAMAFPVSIYFISEQLKQKDSRGDRKAEWIEVGL